jgi:hypothetical protein
VGSGELGSGAGGDTVELGSGLDGVGDGLAVGEGDGVAGELLGVECDGDGLGV